MGVYKKYNEYEGKWELTGCGFRWLFDTEEECDAKRSEAWDKHMSNLNAWNTVMKMLVKYRI